MLLTCQQQQQPLKGSGGHGPLLLSKSHDEAATEGHPAQVHQLGMRILIFQIPNAHLVACCKGCLQTCRAPDQCAMSVMPCMTLLYNESAIGRCKKCCSLETETAACRPLNRASCQQGPHSREICCWQPCAYHERMQTEWGVLWTQACTLLGSCLYVPTEHIHGLDEMPQLSQALYTKLKLYSQT